MTYTLPADAALLKPVRIGDIEAANRLFMAPLTRSRAQADGTPSDLAAQYYAERAGAGLIITEATGVSKVGGGAYVNTPGIYTDRQQHRWAEIATAVHAAGGRSVMQLWHAGRMTHPDISGVDPVGPSTIPADATVHTAAGRRPAAVPRELRTDELPGIVGEFRAAARRAVDAGFDGVEVHGANGYLLHQFLADGVNQRTDGYGGSAANRARLTAEVVEAIADEIGPGRVGLRISPGNTVSGIVESDVEGDRVGVYEVLLDRIAPLDIAYLHVLVDPTTATFGAVRALWAGALVFNGGREAQPEICQLEKLAGWGVFSAAAVGRPFLANPDLIDRLLLGAELNEPNESTFYAAGAVGYVDYPRLGDPVPRLG